MEPVIDIWSVVWTSFGIGAAAGAGIMLLLFRSIVKRIEREEEDARKKKN